MRRYRVKELFGPTIQGEGAHAGRACVFLRMVACNLACSWCDTDFTPAGARQLGAAEIAGELAALDRRRSRMVVVTGGEPTLQWDAELATTLRSAGFAVHMESNGTRPLAAPVDWLTVSPKPQFHGPGDALVDLDPSECKVVVDAAVDDARLHEYERRYPRCRRWYLQPCDGEPGSLERTLALVERNPRWRLSMQLHKLVGLP
jgi:organic radical activating enzyme